MPKVDRGNVPRQLGESGVEKGGSELPRSLRAFVFHGMSLVLKEGTAQAHAEQCPFCGREDNKWSVSVETGKWDCKPCGASGNPLTFVRQLWERSHAATTDWSDLREDRRLLGDEALIKWGACKSIVNGDWLLPAWGWVKEKQTDGTEMVVIKMWQVYRRHKLLNKDGRWVWNLSPTPGVHPDGASHGIFGAHLVDPAFDEIDVMEGPWDGMAWWEAVQAAGMRRNVVAAPGANVFSQSWSRDCSGKRVNLFFDSDRPRTHPTTGERQQPVGWAGMRRVARLLLSADVPPKEIDAIRWNGDHGFNEHLEDGFDVRDALSESVDLAGRAKIANDLIALLAPIPDAWKEAVSVRGKPAHIQPEHCERWEDLVLAWRQAFAWRLCLDDVLSVMIAVAASTQQTGDQLFLQVIGDAASGKTRFCDGMLVSKSCFALEHLTGFHSGFNDGSNEDFSLLSRINSKCLITPEGDVLISNPRFGELMSQQRRIFDGTSGATYKNKKEDMRWTGLRTPWIMAGTPALLDTDQSRLGDRFLKVIISQPTEDQKQDILRRVGFAALRSVRQSSNCDASSTVDRVMLDAYKLTGGYVDWLRMNMQEQVNGLRIDEEQLVDDCAVLADFASMMRARPAPKRNKWAESLEQHDTKEMPSRLLAQFIRLACCLAVVLNKPTVDGEVMRRVRKVTFDTSDGIVLKLAEGLSRGGAEGADILDLQVLTNLSEDKLPTLLHFLSQERVGVLESYSEEAERGWRGVTKWRLTEKMAALFRRAGEIC